MSDKSFLCCTNHQRIYPTKGLEYEAKDILLISAGCVPLLWLALFSESDLETHTFDIDNDGEPSQLTVRAPLAKRRDAIDQLRSRAGFVDKMFKDNGGVAHHTELLLAHLEAAPHEWLTIEWDEIEFLGDPGRLSSPRHRRAQGAG